MNSLRSRWFSLPLDRLPPLLPALLALVGIVVAACNNGSGSSGY